MVAVCMGIGVCCSAHWNKMGKKGLKKALAVGEQAHWWPIQPDGSVNEQQVAMLSQSAPGSLSLTPASQRHKEGRAQRMKVLHL